MTALAMATSCGDSSEPQDTQALPELYLSSLRGDADGSASSELDRRIFDRQETIVVECMKRRGFDHSPRDFPQTKKQRERASDFTSLPYAQRFGFGVVVNNPAYGAGSEDSPEDPLGRTLGRMSPEERTAYQIALYGPPPPGAPGAPSGGSTPQPGCLDEASGRVRDDLGMTSVLQRFESVDTRVRADPRMREAEEAWRQCSATAGYRADSRLALIRQFEDRVTATVGQPGGRAGDSRRALEPVLAEEIAAATATFPCSAALQQVYRKMYLELDANS